MTAVLSLTKFNKRDFKSINGVKNLEAHNVRDEHYKAHKSNIHQELQHLDQIYIKTDKMQELYQENKRKDGVFAIGLVFDFQGLTAKQKKNFNAEKHKKLIEDFLHVEWGLTKEYELIGFSFHGSESSGGEKRSNHYHVEISAKNNKTGKFNINNFINPKNKNGYRSRDNMQKIQDAWDSYLQKKSPYRNRKPIRNLLSFPKAVWDAMSQKQQDRAYSIRKALKLREDATNKQEESKLSKLNSFIKKEVLTLLKIKLDDGTLDKMKTKQNLYNKDIGDE